MSKPNDLFKCIICGNKKTECSKDDIAICNDCGKDKIRTKAITLLLDVLIQACAIKDKHGKGCIDNMCISAYEDACDYLVNQGILLTKNGRIYYLKNDILL